MLNPIGGLGVWRTIAEKENSTSKPWLWIAQKQASKAISKKSQELSDLRRPARIHTESYQWELFPNLFFPLIQDHIATNFEKILMIHEFILLTWKIQKEYLTEIEFLCSQSLPALRSLTPGRSQECREVQNELRIVESRTCVPFCWCYGSTDT